MRTVKVLHVIASLSPLRGGTTSSILQMIESLAAQDVCCEVASSDDDGPGRRLAVEAPERAIPGRHYFPKRCDFYLRTPDIGPWLDANVGDFDIVHIHGLFSHVNGVAGRACRRRGVPYTVTPHGMANRYGMRHKSLRKKLSLALIERPLLEGAALIHMTARSEERDFADLRIETPVVRIPLPVQPIPQACSNVFRARNPEVGNRRIAVFAGRIDPIKNLEAAIDALALQGGSNWHLVVCGDGPREYTATLHARSTSRGVAQRVSWLGFIGERDKAEVFAAGDVYLQPSFSESFGIAAVEAVSAGLPCVLGEQVAVSQDLSAAGFAVAVKPTAEGVAKGFGLALQLRNGNAYFSERARGYVEREFSPATIGAKLARTYELACEGKRPA